MKIALSRPDAKNLNRALEHMDSLGLETGAATPQDAELLYLHKQAYLSKVDREPEYQHLIAELDRRSAGKVTAIYRPDQAFCVTPSCA